MYFLCWKVQSSDIGFTSTFDIPRAATIPSDDNVHKVSIGIINLKPEFEYETVPKKNAYAYIKAKVTNTSEYSLLSGPANVFFENNFVDKVQLFLFIFFKFFPSKLNLLFFKTELKSYSPQEEFTCSLGVDPSIKVEYKPVRKLKEQSGIISKTTSTTYVQVRLFLNCIFEISI